MLGLSSDPTKTTDYLLFKKSWHPMLVVYALALWRHEQCQRVQVVLDDPNELIGWRCYFKVDDFGGFAAQVFDGSRVEKDDWLRPVLRARDEESVPMVAGDHKWDHAFTRGALIMTTFGVNCILEAAHSDRETASLTCWFQKGDDL